jgi:hypothetical protein
VSRWFFGLLFLAPFLFSTSVVYAAPNCQYVLGFKTLHDLDPTDVGDCLDNEGHNPENGDGIQHSINGLLVWRKIDNWTAFTNGYWTWINGPSGLAKRLNTQRYPWEANPTGLPLVPTAAPPPSPAATTGWNVAFTKSVSLSSVNVTDASGNTRAVYPTGKFVRVYFTVTNSRGVAASISSADVKVNDDQGRSSTSDFFIRQVNADGTSTPTPSVNVPPGATAGLALTFDVALNASGIVMHVVNGNDISVG